MFDWWKLICDGIELINCEAHPTNFTLSASLNANVTHLHHGPPKLYVEVQRLQASDAKELLHVAPGGGIFPQPLIWLQYSLPIFRFLKKEASNVLGLPVSSATRLFASPFWGQRACSWGRKVGSMEGSTPFPVVVLKLYSLSLKNWHAEVPIVWPLVMCSPAWTELI